MFQSKKQKAAKHIDKLVTGVIIGGAIASIFGLSKTKKGQEVTQKSKGFLRKGYDAFGKTLSFLVKKVKK